MAEPPVPADGNPSTEDPGENKPWDELFVNNPDEYFGNTNSQKESRPKIGDPKEVALHTFVTDNKYNENRTVRYNMQQLEAMLEHPFAELIIKTPSYEDAQHFYNERSYTAFTDAQHEGRKARSAVTWPSDVLHPRLHPRFSNYYCTYLLACSRLNRWLWDAT